MDFNKSDPTLFSQPERNPMDNMTSYPQDSGTSEAHTIIRRIQTCVIPTICVFGLLANSLAIRTFLSGNLRKSSCSIYLAAKCLSDNGFLLATAIIWSSRFKIPLFNLQGVCQLTVFLTYFCSFLSVWLMAIITCENYIRIAHSFWVNSCCTATRAYIVIAVCTCIGVLLYMLHLWTTTVVYHQPPPPLPPPLPPSQSTQEHEDQRHLQQQNHMMNDSTQTQNNHQLYNTNGSVNSGINGVYLRHYYHHNNSVIASYPNNTVLLHGDNSTVVLQPIHTESSGICGSMMSYQDLLITMTYVDTILTLLLPSIFMFVLVVIILKNVISSIRRRKRLRAGTQRAHGIRRTVTPQAKMTRFLLAVSLIFLLLHTPSHVIRIKMTVEYYVFEIEPSITARTIRRLFELLYYLNFCNNCVVFLMFGENFRQAFYVIFCQRFRHNKKDRTLSHFERNDYLQSEMTELVANPP